MPYRVVRNFEKALCDYTGAKYAVTTNSCTMALLLACKYHNVGDVSIPKHTYVSVPQSIIHAGGVVNFHNDPWEGMYKLRPYPIYDSARRLSYAMYQYYSLEGAMVCLSFHWSKILGIQQGGVILHDDDDADAYLRRLRFDGRTEGVAPKDDHFTEIGYHCYMSPEIAAEGLMRLALLPKHNVDLPNDDYPDLSKIDWAGLK